MIEWSSSRVCMDTRPCFARGEFTQKCSILTKTPLHDGACRFCKARKEVTDGVTYEYQKKVKDEY